MDAVLFSQEVDGNTISNLFSVQTPGQHGIKSRCIVTYLGPDNGTGTWACAKDGSGGPGLQCNHVTRAKHHLQHLTQHDSSVDGPSANGTNELGELFHFRIKQLKLTFW